MIQILFKLTHSAIILNAFAIYQIDHILSALTFHINNAANRNGINIPCALNRQNNILFMNMIDYLFCPCVGFVKGFIGHRLYQEIKDMMSKMKLIEEDIKGAAVDQNI